MERWYLGTMNDGLFIINKPPRPSTDDCFHERTDGPTLVIAVSGITQAKAQEIVDAHNAAVGAAIGRHQADIVNGRVPDARGEW